MKKTKKTVKGRGMMPGGKHMMPGMPMMEDESMERNHAGKGKGPMMKGTSKKRGK